MITTIIFDAFGTLFRITGGTTAKTAISYLADCGKEVNEQSFIREWKEYYKSNTAEGTPFLTEREIFTARNEMLYKRFGVRRDAREDAEALLVGAYEREAYEEVAEVIPKLREKYRVLIGSNTDNDVLEAVMKKNQVMVDKIYTSENLRCYKPNPAFYRRILEDNQLQAQEVLFVGDSGADDIQGPKRAGMKTALINRAETAYDFGQDVTIRNLRELLEILKL